MRTNFSLMQHHKYRYDDLMGMVAWERHIYCAMLIQYLKDENERIKLEKQTGKRR